MLGAAIGGAAEPLRLGDGQREHEAADEVLALAAHGEVAEQADLPAVRLERVVGEGHARTRLAAEVAEDHALHDHGRPPLLGDADVLAVEAGLRRVPRLEHLADAGDDLVEGVVDEDDALVAGARLVGEGDLAHLLGA